MKKLNILKNNIFMMLLFINLSYGQGYNHNWLLGYFYSPADTLALFSFNSTSYSLIPMQRKMPFQGNTQGNISDIHGNLLMSSNGVWIADATNDTMMNGDSLNPSSFTVAYPNGLPMSNGNVFLPMPNDTNKYILIHQTGNYNTNLSSTELYYSIVDMSLNSGLGEVITKNQIIIQDTLGWGINACRHANGRDWWAVVLGDSSDYIYSVLITPNGIDTVIKQRLSNMQPYSLFAGQPTFSPDGNHFAFATGYGFSSGNWYHDIRIFNFDRCTGLFYNSQMINLTDSVAGFGVAFSPNSNFLYTSSFEKIFQINLSNFSVDTIADYDGYNSPYTWCCPTAFYLMYLAANGKIYLTSGNSVQHIHEMNYPDSSGIACNLVQHAIQVNCFIKGAIPVHPNYYLGCDTTSGCPCLAPTGINDVKQHDFKFSISPNPSNGSFKIIYLLPQNKSGTLQIFDITGKQVYKQNLPPWSTMQYLSLPKLANGVYNCTITSNNERVHKKLVVFKE